MDAIHANTCDIISPWKIGLIPKNRTNGMFWLKVKLVVKYHAGSDVSFALFADLSPYTPVIIFTFNINPNHDAV